MKLTRRGLRRGVLLLPSMFTLGNLYCGFFASREAVHGAFTDPDALVRAGMYIVFAMILDGLDGRIARYAHATSPLGMQLDSLADIVSFGVAPGLLVYSWALEDLGQLGWAIAFVFTSCGAIRLARFNVLAGTSGDQNYFVGLPIPAAAGAIAGSVMLWPELPARPWITLLVAAWTVTVGMLMVSSIRYRTFKQVDVKRRRPTRMLLWVLLAFALISAHPQLTIATVVLLYTLSGPLTRVVTPLVKGKPSHEESKSAEDSG